MSALRRKKDGRKDDSLKQHFLELRESGIPDTGPKRPKGRRTIALTPAQSTPNPAKTTPTPRIATPTRTPDPAVQQSQRSSSGGRKRGRSQYDNLQQHFLELKESGIPDTGPKRPKGRRTIALTPAQSTPIPAKATPTPRKATPTASKATPTTVDGPVDISLAPNTVQSQTQSDETSQSSLQTTPESQSSSKTPSHSRVLRSSLKGVHSLSSLQKKGHTSSSTSSHQVSFRKFVTVTEYRPERIPSSEGDSSNPSSSSSSSSSPFSSSFSSPTGSSSTSAGKFRESYNLSLEIEEEPTKDEEEEEEEEEEDFGEEGEKDNIDVEQLDEESEEKFDDEEKEDEEEVDKSAGTEVRMKTPYVVHHTPKITPQPTVTSRNSSEKVVTKKGTIRKQPLKKTPQKQAKTLSRTLIKNLFTLQSSRRLTREATDLVVKFSELYLKQCSEDLAVYCNHAGRKTIETDDVILLLKRQRFITERETFDYLVNTYLPLEYVQELLPCAVAGKKIVPSRVK